VGNVFAAQGPVLPVFEPFLSGLIAADVEFPGGLGNAGKVKIVVYTKTLPSA
jgi:hypothetical protein